MLASFPASILNQSRTDLGIPNRFSLKSSRFRRPPRKPLTLGRIFCGKPVPIPDQVRDRLSPENAPIWLPDQDSNLDSPVNSRASCRLDDREIGGDSR